MMLVKNSKYRIVRRISYSILLVGIVWQIFSIGIKLRESFAIEADIKKHLEDMTPTEFLDKIDEIDKERVVIAIEFINVFSEFFPTVARTNLPEILVKTKVNKGTVGFFGMVSALTNAYLKFKKLEKKNNL